MCKRDERNLLTPDMNVYVNYFCLVFSCAVLNHHSFRVSANKTNILSVSTLFWAQSVVLVMTVSCMGLKYYYV